MARKHNNPNMQKKARTVSGQFQSARYAFALVVDPALKRIAVLPLVKLQQPVPLTDDGPCLDAWDRCGEQIMASAPSGMIRLVAFFGKTTEGLEPMNHAVNDLVRQFTDGQGRLTVPLVRFYYPLNIHCMTVPGSVAWEYDAAIMARLAEDMKRYPPTTALYMRSEKTGLMKERSDLP